MAISHVNTQTNTQTNATSATATKPTGTASGDLLLAFLSSNSQNATPPSGWTEISDEVIEVFRCQVFYKVAGGSEPANYSFSVGSSAPLVLTITCLRGIDTSDPIDIAPATDTKLEHASEPYTTPSVTGGSSGRLLYFRTTRIGGSSIPTYTASGVTELADVGVFSGGTVSYSQGIYLANSDYSTSGSQSGLAITSSQSETHNVVGTIGIKATGNPGSLDVEMPLPSMDVTASWSHVAELEAYMPTPDVDVIAFAGDNEGVLDTDVPVTASITGSAEPTGSFDVIATPVVDIVGETRKFAENVVVPEREERWLIVRQDDIKLGIRNITYLPIAIRMPTPTANFEGGLLPTGLPATVSVTANDATVASATSSSAGAATAASVTANNATISFITPKQVFPGDAGATVTANNATVAKTKSVNAGHASVTCHN